MRRKEKLYLTLMGSILILYVSFQIFGPKPVDWSESYSGEDKIPFGSYILKQEISPGITSGEVLINNQPLYVSLQSEFYIEKENLNWIFFNDYIAFDPFETELLLNRVESGDHIFLAGIDFLDPFADSVLIVSDYFEQSWDSTLKNFYIQSADTFTTTFTNPDLSSKSWEFRGLPRRYFSSVDSARTVILGRDDEGFANFIKIDIGKGSFYMHANAAMFTNFFLREPAYSEYAFTALSYLPQENQLVWDEYYKVGRVYESSPIKYVLSEESLSKAWYLSMIGILAFMIFRSKRRQRIIPHLSAPLNSSVEFAKTIGDLYLEKGSHKVIAIKRIDFFLEYIRNNLGLETYKIDDSFIQSVSERSGIAAKEVDELFTLIAQVRQSDNIDTDTLKTLTIRIDQFYNQSKR